MRRLHADLAIYAILLAVSVIVIREVSVLESMMPGDVGPAFFPVSMAVAVIVLSVIGAIRAVVMAVPGRIDLPGKGRMLVTVLATVAFLLLWQNFGLFYFLGFVYLAGLLIFFMSDGPLRARYVIIILAVSAVAMVLARLFFTEVLYVRF